MALHRRLFFLLILFLPTQLGIHFWPEWTHVLGRRVDYLSPTIYFTDVLLLAVFFTWMVSLRQKKFLRKLTIPFPFSLTAVVLVGVTVGNISVAANTPLVIYKWIKFYEYLLLGWYIIATNVRMKDIVLPLAIAVLYSSLIALTQFILQRSVGGVLWFLGERSFMIDTPGIARIALCTRYSTDCPLLLRSYATFPHPNVFAGFVAVALPYFLLRILRTDLWSGPFWLAIAAFMVSVAGLLTSFSRSAWAVSVIMVLGTWLIVKILSRHKKIATFHPLTVAAFFSAICFIVLVMLRLPARSDESLVIRQQLHQTAIHMWTTTPFFGVGLGNFLIELPSFAPYRAGNFLQPVHNIYVLFMTEAGIAGWGVLLILGGMCFLHRRRIGYAVMHNLDDVTLPLLSLCGVLLLGVVDHYPITLQQGQLLSCVFASVIAGQFISSSNAKRSHFLD